MGAHHLDKSPSKGPNRVLGVVRFVRVNGGAPGRWHQRLITLVKLQPNDPYARFREMMCRTLEIAVAYVQLGVTALASIEFRYRQIQMVEELDKGKVATSSGELGFEVILCSAVVRRSGLCVCPALVSGSLQSLRERPPF